MTLRAPRLAGRLIGCLSAEGGHRVGSAAPVSCKLNSPAAAAAASFITRPPSGRRRRIGTGTNKGAPLAAGSLWAGAESDIIQTVTTKRAPERPQTHSDASRRLSILKLFTRPPPPTCRRQVTARPTSRPAGDQLLGRESGRPLRDAKLSRSRRR